MVKIEGIGSQILGRCDLSIRKICCTSIVLTMKNKLKVVFKYSHCQKRIHALRTAEYKRFGYHFLLLVRRIIVFMDLAKLFTSCNRKYGIILIISMLHCFSCLIHIYNGFALHLQILNSCRIGSFVIVNACHQTQSISATCTVKVDVITYII